MSKYVYPAVFTKEENGYSVRFPDIDGCYTDADTLQDAVERAKDVLCFTLYGFEEDKEDIPVASDIQNIAVSSDEFSTLIACDTLEYRRFYDNKAVKKTLSIPNWLNKEAEAAHINFSSVLKEALIKQLNIQSH